MIAILDSKHLQQHPALAPMQAGSWHASLDLGFSRINSTTRLTEKRHQGPLYVQKPFYPEGKDLAHVYLLHPPGGLVSGDRLKISVSVEDGAQALLTTPGAGRVYRARRGGAVQQQINTFTAGENARLEWFPLESIIYTGADAQLQTEVHLAPSATFSGWEIVSMGLPASGQDFSRGSLKQQCRILQNGVPRIIETLHIGKAEQEFLSMKAGLQSCPVTGFFIAGPFTDTVETEQLLALLQALGEEYKPLDSVRSRCLVGSTRVNGFILCRYLGSCSWQARQFFLAAWARIRPVLNRRPACAPRIWST